MSSTQSLKKYYWILVIFLVTICLTSVVSAEDTDTDGITNIEENVQTSNTVPAGDIEEKDNKKISKELDDESECTGCSTIIIQGYNNDSSISFRRDATNKLTVNVVHNTSIVKQYKENSYFFHVLVSKDGWMVGNGGADNAAVNRAIESNALAMISKNTITSTNMNNIYKQEAKLSLGHFVIKAPNGTYSLIIKNAKKTFKSSGILKAGEYIIVPNSATYYRKGTITDIKTEKSMITSSRLLAARDKFGVNRREILTYYYRNNVVSSIVKVSATNDNGKYAGRKTASKIDNIKTNTKYFSSSSIPILDKSIEIDNINFFIRKTKTTVHSDNIIVNGSNVLLKFNVKDEFGNNVNTGQLAFKVDDKTCKYANGSVIYISVKNGLASYKTSISKMWDKKNHTYYGIYYSNSLYHESKGNTAIISIENPVQLKVDEIKSVNYDGKLHISSIVKYSENNSLVDGGKIFFKINGKTIKDSDGKTLTVNVKKGQAVYDYLLDTGYNAKTYNLTTIYVNGVYRKEFTGKFTVMKVPVKIISQRVNVKNNILYFSGKLVYNSNTTLKYDSHLCVKINGITIRDNDNKTRLFNVENGIINFNFTLPYKYRVGNHTLSIVVPELKNNYGLRSNYVMEITK